MRNETKIADMSKEQLEELKTGLEGVASMIERMGDRMPEGVADKLSKSSAGLKKALDAGNKEDAQKALNALREATQGMFGRRGGDAGGGRGRGGEEGGGGGRQRRGGAGGNREGGGGGGTREGGGGGGTREGGGGGTREGGGGGGGK